MNEIVNIIVKATANAFYITEDELCSGSRDKEIVLARKVASMLALKNGVPARYLAERLKVSRWSVNRLQSTEDTSSYYMKKKKSAESTFKALYNRDKQ